MRTFRSNRNALNFSPQPFLGSIYLLLIRIVICNEIVFPRAKNKEAAFTINSRICALFSQNITGVVAAISDLLCVKIPSSYEVSSTPDRGPLSVLSGPRVGPHGMESRPPMFFHGQGDNGGLHGRPGQMIRPSGGQAMMQQQQPHNFRFHPNSPGE